MIDGAREPETWLDRRPRGNHIAGWRRAKKNEKNLSEAIIVLFTCQGDIE